MDKKAALVAVGAVGTVATVTAILVSRRPTVAVKRPGEGFTLMGVLQNTSVFADGEPAPFTFDFQVALDGLGFWEMGAVQFGPRQEKPIRLDSIIPPLTPPGRYAFILTALARGVVVRRFEIFQLEVR